MGENTVEITIPSVINSNEPDWIISAKEKENNKRCDEISDIYAQTVTKLKDLK